MAKVGPTRRHLLQMAGLLGAATAAGLGSLDALASSAPQGGAGAATAGGAQAGTHQWCFVIDLRKCDGCDKCIHACQKMHYLSKDQKWFKVDKMVGPSGQEYFQPRLCMMCENPPCLRVCPVGATYKDTEGIVLVDQDVCIGCRMCMAACPYDARSFNWGQPPQPPGAPAKGTPEFPVPQVQGTVGKCVFCIHNLRQGKLPACIEACSMDALYVGDWGVDLASNNSETVRLSQFLKEHNAFRLKEELNTRPRVYYIAGHGELVNH